MRTEGKKERSKLAASKAADCTGLLPRLLSSEQARKQAAAQSVGLPNGCLLGTQAGRQAGLLACSLARSPLAGRSVARADRRPGTYIAAASQPIGSPLLLLSLYRSFARSFSCCCCCCFCYHYNSYNQPSPLPPRRHRPACALAASGQVADRQAGWLAGWLACWRDGWRNGWIAANDATA